MRGSKFYTVIVIFFISIILFLAIYPPLHSEAQIDTIHKKAPVIERIINKLKHKHDSLIQQNAVKVEKLEQNKEEFDSLKIIIKKRKHGSE